MQVPNLVGKSLQDASSILKELNLEISINNQQEGIDMASTIITNQMPIQGISVKEGSKIYVDY